MITERFWRVEIVAARELSSTLLAGEVIDEIRKLSERRNRSCISLRKMDTSSWERYHKVATTGTWSQPSKRHDESSKEMLEKYNLNKFSAALTLLSDMHTMSRQLLSTKMKIIVHDEIVRYDVMKNHKILFFKIRRSRNPSKRCINVMGGSKA